MLQIIRHLYLNYAWISSTDLTANDTKLQEPCNTNEPPKSLYTKLNECIDYYTSEGETITKGQLIQIDNGLVV